MSSDSERLRCTWRSISTSGRSVQVLNMILHGYDLDATSRLSEFFQQLQRESAGKLGLTPAPVRRVLAVRSPSFSVTSAHPRVVQMQKS